jgi:Uma2 family endonuclease
LLIEVANSSLRRDRTLKRRIYAAAGIAEYWIVDLRNNVIVVHRDPADDTYRSVFRRAHGELRPRGHAALRIDVAALLSP